MNKNQQNFSCVILAAGKGTRMKSSLPKVLHKIAGVPLVVNVISAVASCFPKKIVVVVSSNSDVVQNACSTAYSSLDFAVQDEQLGTGHAVATTKPFLQDEKEKILVLCGDTPLITSETICRLLEVASGADIAVLGMETNNPNGYGRIITDKNLRIKKIVEDKDANPEEKSVTLCNSGIMAISGQHLFSLLEKLEKNNSAGEYYLTDIIAIANDRGLTCQAVVGDYKELSGINTRAQLAEAEKTMQNRLRVRAMEGGVTMISPESVFLQADTKFGQDIIIHPNEVFGSGVVVEDDVEIRSFSHIEGAYIKTKATIGPFARIRPKTNIGAGAHIGNFVEIKNTILEDGAKANHLSYIGDSEIGEKANIGAGTITCNYDGVNKYKTKIGSGAFIGSNSSLVAPVTIGDKAIVGAGSVITKDVPAENLAISRGLQVNKQKK